jgi:LPXTG-motif cell wall-anchored protein
MPIQALAVQDPAEGYDPEDEMYIKAERDYYWEGRYSDGRIYSEYLANELTGDFDNIVNYAVGGAFTGVLDGTKGEEDEHSNWSKWLKGWGGVQQTERFAEDVNGQADPDALYIVSTILNDGYAVELHGEEKAAEMSSDNTLEMVQNLVDTGAKYIMLRNVSEDDKDANPTDFRGMAHQQIVQKVDAYLEQDSTPDDVEVIYGEGHQVLENIEEQGPEAFGYKNMGFYLISDFVPKYGYGLAAEDNSDIFPTNEEEDIRNLGLYYSTDSKYYDPDAQGLEPDDFYTYDEYHLTSRTHKHNATFYLNSDLETEDGTFEKVYNGEISPFAEAMEEGRIPSEYTMVYTFGASGDDIGRGLEVTTELVNNREGGELPSTASHLPTSILVGLIIAAVGFGLILFRKRLAK